MLDFEFAYDNRSFHADQVAVADAQGTTSPDTTTGIDGTKTFTARHVYWVQPFELANFSTLPE